MAATNPFSSRKLRNQLKNRHWLANLTTSSMIPFLNPGDKIKIEPISFRKISEGQIICFWHPQIKKIVAHRVIRNYRKKGKILTKGDNKNHFDPLIKKGQILGRVDKVFKNKRPISLQTKKSQLLNIIAYYLSLIKYHFPPSKLFVKIAEKILAFFLYF